MKICNITFNREKLVLDIVYTRVTPLDLTFVISDLAIDCTYYIWDVNLSYGSSVWISPLPTNLINVAKSTNSFSGFRCKVYHNKRLIQYEEFVYNKNTNKEIDNFQSTEFDVVGHSYLDFFHSDLCDGIDFSGVVVDAGANVGFFTQMALCRGASRVYTIEPDTAPYFCLQKNFQRNPSVILLQRALTDSVGTTEFFYTDSNVANSTIKPHTFSMCDIVDTINLPTIFQLEQTINLVKLDIEGEEFNVIEKLPSDLYKRTNQFFIEFHATPVAIERRLRDEGFSVYYRHSSSTDMAGFIYASR
jgi:FkbM family methyltransferase